VSLRAYWVYIVKRYGPNALQAENLFQIDKTYFQGRHHLKHETKTQPNVIEEGGLRPALAQMMIAGQMMRMSAMKPKFGKSDFG
jgi:hypothetical protein